MSVRDFDFGLMLNRHSPQACAWSRREYFSKQHDAQASDKAARDAFTRWRIVLFDGTHALARRATCEISRAIPPTF